MTNRNSNSMLLCQPPNSFFAAKRALDLFISILALVALVPLFVIIAVAIKADFPARYSFAREGVDTIKMNFASASFER